MDFLINTVESPEPARSNMLCKELSSFKLDSSIDSGVPEFTIKHSKLDEHLRLSSDLANVNSRVTLPDKDKEYNRGNLKTKPNEKHQQQRSHFS